MILKIPVTLSEQKRKTILQYLSLNEKKFTF